MNCSISRGFFLEADGVESDFGELELEEGVVVDVGAGLIDDAGLFVVDDHIDRVDVGVHVVTEQHRVFSLIHLKLKTCHISLDYNLHRPAQ